MVTTEIKVDIKITFDPNFISLSYLEARIAVLAAAGMAVIKTGICNKYPEKPSTF